MFNGLFKDARFGPFSNLHTCISLVEVCRFAWVKDFRPFISFVFLLACVRAFSKIHVCRFGERLKVASLKSQVSIGWDHRT